MKDSKLGRRIFGAVSLLLMLFAANSILGEMLESASAFLPFIEEMETFARENEKVDLVIVGNSRAERTFDPAAFEAHPGFGRTINAGSTAQTVEGSYYQLRDLIDRFHPRYAVYSIAEDILNTGENRTADWIVLIKVSGETRRLFLSECKDPAEQLMFSLKSYRNRLFLPYFVSGIFGDTRELDTLRYYGRDRFHDSAATVEDGSITIENAVNFDPAEFDEQKVEYLDKIVDLCAQNDVKLFLLAPPTSMTRIYYTGDVYQDASEFLADYARAHGLVYHNLNYLRDREELFPDSAMLNYNHIGGQGARVVSALCAEILQKDLDGVDTSGYFYGSLSELKESVHRVVTVSADFRVHGDSIRVDISSLHNDGVVPQYQLLLAVDGENFEVISDWSEADHLEVDISGTSSGDVIQVRARTGEPGEIEAFHNYTRP